MFFSLPKGARIYGHSNYCKLVSNTRGTTGSATHHQTGSMQVSKAWDQYVWLNSQVKVDIYEDWLLQQIWHVRKISHPASSSWIFEAILCNSSRPRLMMRNFCVATAMLENQVAIFIYSHARVAMLVAANIRYMPCHSDRKGAGAYLKTEDGMPKYEELLSQKAMH